jgi:DNA-binding MarR family transcriptional regulator
MDPHMADNMVLDRQLCFRLYAASRAIQRQYRPVLDSLGITYPQYLVLLALWQWEAETPRLPHSIKDLGNRLTLDSGTMTPLIRRMEAAGLLIKSPGETDARLWMVMLTPKGRALKSQAAAVPETVTCLPGAQPLLGDIPALLQQLDRLLAVLSEAE